MTDQPNADLSGLARLSGLCTRCGESSQFTIEKDHKHSYLIGWPN